MAQQTQLRAHATPGGVQSFVAKTAAAVIAYTASIGDFVRVDPTAGALLIRLVASVAANKGGAIAVKNVSASTNTITVDGTGSDTLDGATKDTITTARGVAVYVSDGAGDYMISSENP